MRLAWLLVIGLPARALALRHHRAACTANADLQTRVDRLKLESGAFDSTYANLLCRYDPKDYENPEVWLDVILTFSDTYLRARSDHAKQIMAPWHAWYDFFENPLDATPEDQARPAMIHIVHDLPLVLKNYEHSKSFRRDFDAFVNNLFDTLDQRVGDSYGGHTTVTLWGRLLVRIARTFSYKNGRLLREGRHRLAQTRITSALRAGQLWLNAGTRIAPLTRTTSRFESAGG